LLVLLRTAGLCVLGFRLLGAGRDADLTAVNINASTSPATFQALAFEDYAPVLGSASDRRDRTRQVFAYN
jgi:hypothetical protein